MSTDENMAEDHFNSWRKRMLGTMAPAPAQTPPPPSAPELVVNNTPSASGYLAFDAKDKVRRLDIRTAEGMAHSIAYSYLLNLSYDRAHWQGFFLYTSTVAVMVKGRNLQKVVEAIRLHTCEYIQEFDPATYKVPPGADEPFIELMQVEVVGPGMNLFADGDGPKKQAR